MVRWNTRWSVPAPPGSGKKTIFLLWNKAVLILSHCYLPSIYSAAAGLTIWESGAAAKLNRLHLRPCQVCYCPSPSTNWERLITISRSDLSNPIPVPEAPRKTFKPINFMVCRITAFPYCCYCSTAACSCFTEGRKLVANEKEAVILTKTSKIKRHGETKLPSPNTCMHFIFMLMWDNKTEHGGEPEQTAGVRKPKTKATVTLMEFLVIKETFDVSAQQNSFLCSLRL